MPEHSAGPPGDESGIRPELVQAIFSALVDMDPGKLAPLEANGIRITPAERKQADELYLAACSRAAVSGNAGSRPAGADRRPQVLRAPAGPTCSTASARNGPHGCGSFTGCW